MRTHPLSFGTFIMDMHDTAGQAARAEALGYDFLCCGEHVAFHGPVPNSYIALACAAGATQRIELMSGIVLLPLYPAALAAKLGAALDVVCGGRFVFGVGVGGEIAKEFEACGVPLNERGPRTDEALALIKRLWTERGVNFAGRFNTLNDITIDPPPLRKPHPPIWVAGRKDSAARRAGRYADGWLPYMYTPEQLHESITKVRAFAEQAGRDPESVRAGIFIWSAVHEDAALAKRAASEYLSANYAQDFSKLAPRYALAGDPAQCVARLAEYINAGAERVVLAPAWSASAESVRSIALMARSVMPAFR